LSVEKPQKLRLAVALRATEKRPRSAVREFAQRHADAEFSISETRVKTPKASGWRRAFLILINAVPAALNSIRVAD
jgi:hypothetical protein